MVSKNIECYNPYEMQLKPKLSNLYNSLIELEYLKRDSVFFLLIQ